MQSHFTEHQPAESSEPRLHLVPALADARQSAVEDSSQTVIEPTLFCSRFVDHMELYADARTVAEYLDAHQVWFRRCAQPMTVEPIGETGYMLVIGRFGSFGYEIEPKIGLNLLPQEAGVYRIETISIPDYETLGYDVDFRAAMKLIEADSDDVADQGLADTDVARVTRVQWQLDLAVTIQFPRFIQALPKSLIQSTGDRLLNRVVRQVSQRLTRKVQEDFCETYGIPLPKRPRKWFFHKSEPDLESVAEHPEEG